VPTYDYQCRDCGTTVEVIHPMQEDGPSACERCGGELRRVLYPSGIIFKGSGFYKTDSRSSSSASVAPATRSPGGTAAKDGGSSDKGSSDKGSSDKGSSDRGSSTGDGSKGASAPATGSSD
jgi:putative FmdB family regulatory protein